MATVLPPPERYFPSLDDAQVALEERGMTPGRLEIMEDPVSRIQHLVLRDLPHCFVAAQRSGSLARIPPTILRHYLFFGTYADISPEKLMYDTRMHLREFMVDFDIAPQDDQEWEYDDDPDEDDD